MKIFENFMRRIRVIYKAIFFVHCPYYVIKVRSLLY